MSTKYIPQVNDYVIWNRPNGDIEQGWVYFVGDIPEVKRGFPTHNRYLTIEIGTKDKKECIYTSGKPMLHKKHHICLLCYEQCWNQLQFVKRRKSKLDDTIILTAEELSVEKYNKQDENSVDMYKSQEHRYEDV